MRNSYGELIGFEIDVAKKLAEDMEVEVEFSIYPWEQIILRLESGEIDVIAAGLSITPALRLQAVAHAVALRKHRCHQCLQPESAAAELP